MLPTMENRYSFPPADDVLPRPHTQRQRSNSFPIVEALGCSAAEAKIILAEGRAAVWTRSLRRRGRRNLHANNATTTYQPKSHMQYLNVEPTVVDNSDDEPGAKDRTRHRHSRVSSGATDRSTSTVTGPVRSSPGVLSSPGVSPTLGDYSASLAKFIKSQLNSIPTFTSSDPRSYPGAYMESSSRLSSPPRSPMKLKKPAKMEPEPIIEIPPIRPPLTSTFSEWSSTDDDDDDEDEEIEDDASDKIPALSGAQSLEKDVAQYCENTTVGSFFFATTPPETASETTGIGQHPNINSFTFPADPPLSRDPSKTQSPGNHAHDYPSSSASAQPNSSSAPSFSSTSTGSYFDYKRPITFAPQMKDRIIAAVSPHLDRRRVLTAISPFEGGALANVHDIFVESNQRVVVEGLSFDLVRDLKYPEEGAMRFPTPC